MTTFTSLRDLAAASGTDLGRSDWHRIDQERVTAFADATGDHQWIHLDPERAKAGPFGTTVAHGYLTLALIPMLMAEIFQVSGVRMAINYGLNRVRFPAPARTGSSVRAAATIDEVSEVPGGVQVLISVTIETDDGDKPCCVAETVSRFMS
jgi:acyl dehydratase